MSNIANLSRQIANLSLQLTNARANSDDELAEQLSYELNDLEDQLEEAEEATRDGGYGWS
jgi:hypothetical protein